MSTGAFSLQFPLERSENPRFARYAWLVLAYTVAVILWGAYVRATGSGAGCGSHWPLCNGEVVPRSPRVETLIEFTHRITSGLSFLLVLGLFLWAWRAFPRRHPVWLGARLAMFFIVTESLVGAALVLFELVAYNPSATRAAVMAVHLANTLLLLASLTLTAWWASGGPALRVRGRDPVTWLLGLGLLGVMVIGATGAITALGDTLFHTSSLAEGLREDFSPTAHFLIRLRVIHPVLAILVGAYVAYLVRQVAVRRGGERVTMLSYALVGIVLIQWVAGVVNILLLAPVWMQILHLFIADVLWIALVLFSAETFARGALVQG